MDLSVEPVAASAMKVMRESSALLVSNYSSVTQTMHKSGNLISSLSCYNLMSRRFFHTNTRQHSSKGYKSQSHFEHPA